MPARPKAVAFDVLETLFPLEPMRLALARAGLVGESLEVWFARTLRDGFALSAAGDFKPFKEVAAAELAVMLQGVGVAADAATIEGVLSGMTRRLPPPPTSGRLSQPSVMPASRSWPSATAVPSPPASSLPPAVWRIRSHTSSRSMTWPGGSRRRGLSPRGRGRRGSAGRVGAGGGARLGLPGTKHAGLAAAWVKRKERAYLSAAAPPDVSGDRLAEVCGALLGLPSPDPSREV